LVDDVATKGKRNIRKKRLARCEESPNGGAKRWLAGGKWVAVAYLGDGENSEKKKASASIFLFIVEREREREEVVPVPHVGVGWV
jgi:hypothetical protein